MLKLRNLLLTAVCTAALALWAVPAPAQDDIGPAAPALTDSGVRAVKEALAGSWRTRTVDPATGEEDDLWMHIAPVQVAGIPDTLFVEHAWGSHIHRPFRYGILQVFRYRDNIRVRTYEFRRGKDRAEAYAGLWAAPDQIPAIDADDLFATLDIDLEVADGRFRGQTPFPYPTRERGAFEHTSRLGFDGTSLTTSEAGYAGDGSVAWSTEYQWRLEEPGVDVRRDEDGFVMVEYPGAEGDPGTEGDVVFIDYAGFRADGELIDAAAQRGTLTRVMLPISTGIPGMDRGLENPRQGAVRKVVIPPNLGYGEHEVEAGLVPPNATLFYRFEFVRLERGEPDRPSEPDAPQDDPHDH